MKFGLRTGVRVIIAGFILMAQLSCRCSDQKSSGTEQFLGIYEYTYEHNTADLTENHYLDLGSSEGKLLGTYYGTSDDFDAAREGYLPGFFKSDLQEISFQDGILKFKIVVREDDFFSDPITPDNATSPAKKWPQASGIGGERFYEGKFLDRNLILQGRDLPARTFNKR